ILLGIHRQPPCVQKFHQLSRRSPTADYFGRKDGGRFETTRYNEGRCCNRRMRRRRRVGEEPAMWKLSPGELLQLKGAGGERVAHFVDRLIRAEAARGGLPQSELLTQLRANIKDGGVDTQVRRAIPGDPTGWLSVPTCWQFKSVEASDIDDKTLEGQGK